MKRISLALAIATGFCLNAQSESRIIDYPFISYSNTNILDIAKVEISDTATIVTFDARFIPKNWIQIGKEASLEAGGRKYALRSGRDITLGEKFWMPESGQASFSLIFDPLPISTKKFDFKKGDSENDWQLVDILLDRNPSIPHMVPTGLPDGILTDFVDGPLPTQPLTIGETTVNVHYLGDRKEFASKLSFIIDEAVSDERGAAMKFDEDGNATVKFTQYGPAKIQIIDRDYYLPYANFSIIPGDTVDCYIDGTISGHKSMQHRGTHGIPVELFGLQDGKMSNFERMKMNAIKEGHPNYSSWLKYGGKKLYDLSREEYMKTLKEGYLSSLDSIMNSELPQMEKGYQTITLQDLILRAVADHKRLMRVNYLQVTDRWNEPFSYDSIPATLTDEDFREVTTWFDVSDPRLLVYGNETAVGLTDWNAYGVKGDLSKSLRMLYDVRNKAGNATLTKEEVDAMRSLSDPFFAQVADSLYAEMNIKISNLKSSIKPESTPEVAVDQIFDAIVAPHKGKVVVVDLWNTWCAPCRKAIKQNEPLKSSELSSEDIVWIYIADESSDHFQYLEMIPNIKGLHYKLSKEQMEKISERFKVDGIPYYILVDREGNAKGRPDLRDHSKYIKEIKGLL